jgi:hypothetical protein
LRYRAYIQAGIRSKLTPPSIYEADPVGDGCFDSDEERDYHLEKIALCIKDKMG